MDKMLLIDTLSTLFLLCVMLVAGFLILWSFATMNIFFGFIKEGQGISIERGKSYVGPIISLKGYHLVSVMRNGYERHEIVQLKPGEHPNTPDGILGFLQKKFGIFWLGTLPPFRKIMEYKFRWNEWEEVKDDENSHRWKLRHREETTTFFYAQTFAYALVLDKAETGGKMVISNAGAKSSVGGNVEVDLKIVLLIKIICPEIALVHNENWFDQLGALVLDHAGAFVRSRTFEEIRLQKNDDNPNVINEIEYVHSDFCEHIMKLNKHAPIGDTSESIVDVYGVMIVGAHILEVDLAGESKKLASSTTAIYVAEQEAQASNITADAKAYGIRAVGTAEAEARKARTKAVLDFGRDGIDVLHEEAMLEAGKSGGAIIFASNKQNDTPVQFVLPQQTKKKEATNE